ncbi:MAG: hypothetical protein HW403_915, partial [Dehalococcoidia bacterium]|nr:hypothetical protein [Dehalococcoidia bacterium]
MTLEFGPRKTFSELLSELSRDVAASKLHDYVWALWRPVSSVVQLVPGLDLRDTIFDDWARQAGMVANLRRCTEYREMIEKGHGLSRGSPQSKVEAKWCFERALDLAGALRARGGLPISLALPMQSDAESRVASCDFYTGNYAFADDRLKSAQHSLDSAVGNNEFPTYGLVAQKVT